MASFLENLLRQGVAGGAGYLRGRREGRERREEIERERLLEQALIDLREAQTGESQARTEAIRTPVAPEPISLSRGEQLLDPTTREVIAENPYEPGTMELYRQWEQLPPEGRESFEQFMQTQRTGGTTVNVGDRLLTQVAANEYEQAVQDANTAEGQLQTLEAMNQLLDQGIQTGRIEELTMPLRELGASFGVGDVERLNQQQLFQALSNRMALEARQLGLVGQMSDRDVQFLQAMVPQLRNTPEGNRRLIQTMRRIAQRKVEMADLMEEYIAENDSLAGWRAFRSQWVQDNPAFEGTTEGGGTEDEDRRRIRELMDQGLSEEEILRRLLGSDSGNP